MNKKHKTHERAHRATALQEHAEANNIPGINMFNWLGSLLQHHQITFIKVVTDLLMGSDLPSCS
jgi:hypothetical protein